MPRNPNWTRDELILALDLYFKGGRKQLDPEDPRVGELSALLSELPIHPEGIRKHNFRSRDSVSMKLGNFLRVDPAYEGAGLGRGSQLEHEVWNDFAGDRETLHRAAEAIRSSYQLVGTESITLSEQGQEQDEFREGKILTRVHKRRERNARLVRRKKESVLVDTGRLACEVCGFDFAETYGELGEGFAECHHRTPIAELDGEKKTRLSDLAIVCANCHRMIHRSDPMLSVEELRVGLA